MSDLFEIAANSVKLTKDSCSLFMAYWKDAGNWSGNPLVGGNVRHGLRENGNLTDLKKAGLLTTFAVKERNGKEDIWIEFTSLGKAYAKMVEGYEKLSTKEVEV